MRVHLHLAALFCLTSAAALAETIAPDGDPGLVTAASVIKTELLAHQGDHTVRLFGTAGGDPAMNGLYTYLAFPGGPEFDARIFKIGDVLDYRVVEDAPGRLVLAISESTLNAETGDIGQRDRRLNISWKHGADDAPPETVSVQAAD